MFMVLKKKQMVMTAVVLMLGIAGYLNYRYDKEPVAQSVSVEEMQKGEPDTGEAVMVSSEAAKEEEDFFAKQKLEKDRANAKKSEELSLRIEDENLSDETKKEAEEELAKMIEREEQETRITNMLFN